MTITHKTILFIIATIVISWISRPVLRDVQHHGFYRFLSWETTLILFLINVDNWFVDPFSLRQTISWILLTISLVLVYEGVKSFRRMGRIDQDRSDPQLIGIEKTTRLVATGIYRYIRHPFYSSLLFLGWGIMLKDISWIGFTLAFINSVLLVLTARKEEVENIQYFGDDYRQYMAQTKMFVPYLF